MPRLSRSTLPAGALIGAPAPQDPSRAGMIHLGLGAFHRAHAAVHTALALEQVEGDWGIIGFANRSHGVVDPMRAQDHLYAVLQLSERGRAAGVVDVHRGLGVMAEEPERVVAEIADPARRILTLTVSEAGYGISPRTGTLDADAPAIRRDIADPAHPRTVIGMLARGLVERAATGEPFAVLPCDNVQRAAPVLERAVTEFLHAAGADDDALAFLRDRVAFPQGMVDRIVPQTSPETLADVERLLGVRDEAPVRAEEFTMWVLEDRFPGGRPAWERGGVIFTDEVEGYEQVKLRVLNGTHSLLAYLGGLAGCETIPQAFGTEVIGEAAIAMIRRDMLPSIDLPSGFDPETYLESLTSRWRNHALGDLTSRVGSDGSMKLPQRIPGPYLHAREKGRMPHLLALVVAGWIAAVAPPAGFAPGPIADAMADPQREALARLTVGASGPADHARRILEAGYVSDALRHEDALIERVGELLGTICRAGALTAAREALDAES